MLIRIHRFILTTLLVVTSSCGYFSDDPVENSDLYTNTDSLSGQCALDPDEFGRIFERDIQAQIECVRDNFIQFSRYVRTNDADNISEDELQHFVSKFFSKNSDAIIKGLQVLFEVNMLLLRDHAGNLSRGNIDPLYKLLLSINKQGIEVAQALTKMTGPNHHLYFHKERERLRVSLNELSVKMSQVINQRDGLPQNLNIKEFILGLNDSFNVGGDRFDEELVDSLLFLKRLFIGGERDLISSDEMLELVELVPDLVIETFDLIFISPKLFENRREQYVFYQTKIVNISGLLHKIVDNKTLFTEDDIYKIYEAIISNEQLLNLEEYKVIIRSIKKNIIGGHPTNYTFQDLKKALLAVNLGIEGLSFVHDAKSLLTGLEVRKSQDLSAIKNALLKRTQTLQDGLHLRINELPYLPKEVQFLEFFKTLNDEVPAMEYNIDLIEALFAVKTLSVGGEKQTLTKKEFYAVLKKLPSYVKIFFDFRYEFNTLSDPEQKTIFFERQLQVIEALLTELSDDHIILKQSDVYALIEALEEDERKQKDLKAVFKSFQTNILLSKNPNISFNEIKQTLNYAKVLNKSAGFLEAHRKTFKKIDEAESKSEYLVAKDRYMRELKGFLAQVKELIINNDIINEGEEVQFFSFVIDLAKNIDLISIDYNLLEDMLPIKQAILGGEKRTLTRSEFIDFTHKAPKLVSKFLDIYKYGLNDQNLSFFVNTSKILDEAVISKSEDMDLITMSELIDLAANFSDLPFHNFFSSLIKLKKKVLGGDANIITLNNIKQLISYGRDFAEGLYFNAETYDVLENYLNTRTNQISFVPALDLSSYDIIRKSNLPKLRAKFEDSIQKHRYFTQKSSGLQFWGHPYKRSKYGFQQLATIKWLVVKIIKAWGHRDDALPENHGISLEEVEQALNDFKPILVEYGLWTAYPETFARNTLLLGDLFQNTSNGDMNLDIDELSEYGTMVLSAINLSNDFLSNLLNYCDPINGDNLNNYSFADYCYREHMFPIIFNELKYERYLPMLSKFVDESKSLTNEEEEDEALNYLINVEGFVRDSTTSEIPRREFTLIVGAMLNIETTFIRFDKNKNNQLDPEEIDKAFVIYEEAIISVAELSDEQRKYAKTIFLYMLKEKRIPSTWELLRYHYSPFADKEIVAKRLNIGALLYWLVRQ